MKTIYILFFLMIFSLGYSQNQDYKQKIKEIEESEKATSEKLKTIKSEIKELNKIVKNNFIDTTQTIIYDFKSKEYKKSNVAPRVGEPIIFKIKNINRLAYEVNIKSNDVAIADEFFKEDITQVLKGDQATSNNNETPTKKNISEPLLIKTDLKIENEISETKTIEELQTSNTEIITKINQLKKDKTVKTVLIANYTNELEVIKNKVDLTEDDKKTQIKEIQVKINSETEEELKLQKEVDSLESLTIENQTKIIRAANVTEAVKRSYDEMSKLYSEILYESQKMQNIEDSYQNFRQLALSPLLKYDLYKTLVEDKNFIIFKLPQYRMDINNFDKCVNNFINFYNQSINNWEIFDKIESASAKDNIRMKYQSFKEEVDKINENISALSLLSKIRKVEAIHSILVNENAYEMVSSPIQPLEDYVTFDVSIKHRDISKQSEYNDNREFTYMEYTKGGVRFDFSTGIVLNFIGNNDKYELKNVVGSSTKKKIVITDNNQFTPSLAGMFHTSFRRSGIWAFGLTLGASLNVETFQLNSLFPGVSILIGKKQKFIMSAGPAFRQVEELKDNYNIDQEFDSNEFNDETELTSKQFKVGMFFGITYNLTQKQRAKFKIGSN